MPFAYATAMVQDGCGTASAQFTWGCGTSHTDITETKVIQAKLIDSEAHLRAIVKNEPECIKIVDKDGILVQMNPAGLGMIEANTLEQVVGGTHSSVRCPRTSPGILGYASTRHRWRTHAN